MYGLRRLCIYLHLLSGGVFIYGPGVQVHGCICFILFPPHYGLAMEYSIFIFSVVTLISALKRTLAETVLCFVLAEMLVKTTAELFTYKR